MKKFLTLLLMFLMVFNVISFAETEVVVDPTPTTDTTTSTGILGLSVTTWLIILVGALLLIILVSSASKGRNR